VDRCALFVDAGYALSDGALAVHGTRHRDSVSWDYAGLLKLLAELSRDRTGLPVLRCYWYEATVDSRRTPEHETLADIPGLKLRLGKVRPGRREGVETEIRRDLTALARNKAVSDVVIVSAEEDLSQVISDVQDQGIRVAIVHIAADGSRDDWTVSRALRQECDDIIEISVGHLRPYVDLIPGAEPASRDEESSLGFPPRTAPVHQPAAAPAGSSGTGLYPAPVSAEFPRTVPPPGPPPQPMTPAASQPAGGTMIGTPAAAAAGPANGAGSHASPGDSGSGPNAHGGEGPGLASDVRSRQDGADAGRPGQGAPRSDDGSRMAAHQQYQGADSLHGSLPVPGQPSQPGQVPAGLPHGGLGQGMHAAGPQSTGPQPGLAQLGGSQHGSSQQTGPQQISLPPGGPGLGGPPPGGQPRGAAPAQPGDPAPGAGPQGSGFPNGGQPQNGLSRGALPPGGLGQNGGAHSAPPQNGLPHSGLPQNGPPQNGLPQNGLSSGGAGHGGGLQQGSLPPGGFNGMSGNGMPPSGFGQHSAGEPRGGELPRGGLPQHAQNGPPQHAQNGLPPGGPPSGLPQNAPPQNALPQNSLPQNLGGGLSQVSPPQGQLPPQHGSLPQGALPPGTSQQNGSQQGGQPGLDRPPAIPAQRQLPPGQSQQYQPGLPPSYGPGQPQQGQGQQGQGQGQQGQFGGYAPPGQPGQGYQQNSGPYDTPQLPAAIQPSMPQPVAIALPDAVQAAHAEGFGFGEAVARDAPALWLEAVLARKPRMPSDLEARLLQGSALPIDSLLHDEVRHALRRGFWDALERSRR
jgi:hypothetical protein